MRTWILLIGLCSAAAATAQTPLTRADAVARAWHKNLGLQVAQLQEQAAEVNNVWGAAGALPTVGLTSSLSTAVSDQTRNPTSFIQARLGSQSFNAGANAAWTLYDGGGMFATKRSLELLAEQAGGQAALLAEQTAVAVLVAYDAVLVQQAFFAVLEESITLSRDRLAWSMARTELGVSSTFDRLQFENAVLADSSALLQQRLAVSTALRNLNRLMGEQEDAVWALTSALDVPAAAPALPALRTEVLANTRAVRNAVLAQSIAEVGIDQAEARLYPVVGLSTALSNQQSQFNVGDLRKSGAVLQASALLTLNFNVFNGGATRRAIEQAQIRTDIAGLTLENERREAARLLADAHERLEFSLDVLRLARATSDNAAQLTAIGAERLSFGVLNSLNYRDLQLALQRARVQELTAIQAARAAATDIERLRGALVAASPL
jgi:outer membrane protein TolC